MEQSLDMKGLTVLRRQEFKGEGEVRDKGSQRNLCYF